MEIVPLKSDAARGGLSIRSSPAMMPMLPTISGEASGPFTVRSERATPPEAKPLANAPRIRRSTAPATARSTVGFGPVTFAPPDTITSLPCAFQRRFSIRAVPFSSRSRVGDDCVKGTPARVSDASSRTIDARIRSIANASASAVTVAATVPAISCSCEGSTNGASTLGVMPVSRATSVADVGSFGSDASHVERQAARLPALSPGGGSGTIMRSGTAPSASSFAPCQVATSDCSAICARSMRASSARSVSGGRSP